MWCCLCLTEAARHGLPRVIRHALGVMACVLAERDIRYVEGRAMWLRHICGLSRGERRGCAERLGLRCTRSRTTWLLAVPGGGCLFRCTTWVLFCAVVRTCLPPLGSCCFNSSFSRFMGWFLLFSLACIAYYQVRTYQVRPLVIVSFAYTCTSFSFRSYNIHPIFSSFLLSSFAGQGRKYAAHVARASPKGFARVTR